MKPELTILYEDASLVVCVKPVGVLSQADAQGGESMLTLLADHFRATGETAMAYPIHRLDRNVGGVMVYGKTKTTAAALSAAVQQNKLVKEYYAILRGVPEQNEGTLTDLLFKDSAKNKSYVVKRPRKGVKEAKLDYWVLNKLPDGTTVVRIRLHTGRSHQIRVQFSSRGLPLVGDGKYGARDNRELMLFSCRLTFPHPETKKEMTFSADPHWASPI